MEIESSIPVPEDKFKGKGKRVYPFEEMCVSDSFWAHQDGLGKYGAKLRSAVSHRNNRKKDGKKFIVRKDSNGYRCWRIE